MTLQGSKVALARLRKRTGESGREAGCQEATGGLLTCETTHQPQGGCAVTSKAKNERVASIQTRGGGRVSARLRLPEW